MKIGILTIYPLFNYGGIMQAYALQKVLKDKGHEVWIINRQKNRLPYLRIPLAYIKRCFLKYFLKKNIHIFFFEKKRREQYRIKGQKINLFINRYIQPQTTPIYDIRGLKKLNKKYKFHAYIVGSDQVWRPEYVYNQIEDYFLGFTKRFSSIIRISYAASFGTDEWQFNKKQEFVCKNLAKKFNAVSVREDTAIDICKNKFGITAKHVLDPTMLLDKSEYIKLFLSSDSTKSEGNFFIYILNESKEKELVAKEIVSNLELIPFEHNSLSEFDYLDMSIAKPVEEWIRAFYDASFILTDSFHGTVFSIIFNKPFIVFNNQSRGVSRFVSLLQTFNLENRMINSFEDFSIKKLKANIDWKSINKILQIKKKISNDFLDFNLCNT